MIRALCFAAALALPAGALQAPKEPIPCPVVRRNAGGLPVVATWYQVDGSRVAWSWHGNPAARMRPGCLTAAHRTLPFGSRLRVTRGDRAVTVVVTDRGPEPWTGSDLDLSEAAAVALGMRAIGRAPVSVEVLR